MLTLGEVQKILHQLPRKGLSIRDLGTILETLVEAAPVNKNPLRLVEAMRHALGRALVRPALDERGELKEVTVDRSNEEECSRSLNPQAAINPASAVQPNIARRLLDGLRRAGRSCSVRAVLLAPRSTSSFVAGWSLFPEDRNAGTDRISLVVHVQSIGAVR